MPTPTNYLTLTEKQKQYVRDNCTKVSVDTIVRDLYPMSRHEVMKFIIAEKLSMKIVKTKKQESNDTNRPHTHDISRRIPHW